MFLRSLTLRGFKSFGHCVKLCSECAKWEINLGNQNENNESFAQIHFPIN